MGRNVNADRTPLLQNAEQNIGNSATLFPATGNITIVPSPQPTRVVDLRGGSAVGQSTSVTLACTRIGRNQNPNPGYPGPITGVIDFGNGGRDTRLEVDVPVGPFIGSLEIVEEATQPQDGVVIVSVPTGVLRAYFRYDNLLLSPVVGTSQCLAQLRGVDQVGPGGPRFIPAAPPYTVPAEPVLVKGMAAYFTRHYAKATKTNYLYCSNPAPITQSILVGNPVSGQVDFFCLPAYSQNVKVLRLPLTSALYVFLHDGVQIVDQYTIAAGTSAPVIPVSSRETIVGIRSVAAGDTVSFLALNCEVGI